MPCCPSRSRKGVETPVARIVRMRLVEERRHRGWSQQELADYLGTTQHNVSRWEAGLTTPGPYFRTKLGELFGMSVQELLVRESDARPMSVREVEGSPQLFMDVKKHARQAALTGNWDGMVRHEVKKLDYHVTLQLKLAGRTIRGTGYLHDAHQSGDLTQSVTVSGRFVYDRFLKLEYTLEEPPGAIQFGFALLEFTPDGQALSGPFLGYGALVTRGMVTGTVHLERQETSVDVSVPPHKAR